MFRIVQRRLLNPLIGAPKAGLRKGERIGITGTMAFHATRSVDNPLIYGGIAVLGTVVTLKYAMAAYRTYQESKPAPEEAKQEEPAADSSAADDTSIAAEEEPMSARAKAEAKVDSQASKEGGGGSAFSGWFARNYYDGGFEEKMTRREAALILGVRETATVERIKEAHRRVLILNHPDKGGSAFLAAKVNEAKDLLLKGREI